MVPEFYQIYHLTFSSYYIRQASIHMKPKKKTSSSVKKTSKKPTNNKPLLFVDKTIVTTKEKTHITTQEPVQIKDLAAQIRTPRDHINRFSCKEKLQECNLSPFSSPGGSSISPRCRKVSPMAKQEKQKKRHKQKPLMQPEKVSQKKKIQQQKRQLRVKPKTAKEQCNLTYQNFVLKKLDQKKITQLSQESEVSISKFNKLNMNLRIPKDKEHKETKNIHFKVKELKERIVQKYKREMPFLKQYQLKFYCSIVLIQRLWRQKKMKSIISQFISPRSNPQYNITTEIHRQNNLSKIETTGTSQEQTSELIRKYHNLSPAFQKKEESTERERQSTQIRINHKKDSQINLKDLQLSAQLSPEKEKKILRFVECVRDIKFSKPTQSKKKNRMNVFNLEQSCSQKCLMQSFYSKVFKNSPTKVNNFEIFHSKKQQKQLQRSIQLINIIKSPKKAEIIELQERFETELHSSDAIVEVAQEKEEIQKINHVEAGVDTSGIQEYKHREISSLKEITLLSQQIIFTVLTQFCEQFHAFTSKSILRKKKKNTLPGLKVTSNSIKQYLTGFTGYMMDSYQTEVLRRFTLINPINFLKIHHEYDEEDDYLSEEEDQMNMPIIPNTLFYEYQLLYESQKFVVQEQDKKFSNFLQSLIKIHNLLLSNCLSQVLQKKRVDRMVLPWDNKFSIDRLKKTQVSKKSFEGELTHIVSSLCDSAFVRLGQFHKRLDDAGQQQKLLKSIRSQYKEEGNEWCAQYEFLELRMDLTKFVQQFILEQLMQDIMIFF